MMLRIPEEISNLRLIFGPYMDGCHLRDDAPKEAKEAYEKYDAWFDSMQGPYEQ